MALCQGIYVGTTLAIKANYVDISIITEGLMHACINPVTNLEIFREVYTGGMPHKWSGINCICTMSS